MLAFCGLHFEVPHNRPENAPKTHDNAHTFILKSGQEALVYLMSLYLLVFFWFFACFLLWFGLVSVFYFWSSLAYVCVCVCGCVCRVCFVSLVWTAALPPTPLTLTQPWTPTTVRFLCCPLTYCPRRIWVCVCVWDSATAWEQYLNTFDFFFFFLGCNNFMMHPS